MSQFHNLFRNVVVEKDPPPSHPVRDTPDIAETNYTLRDVQTVHVRLEAANRLIFQSDPRSIGAERFRLLRMRLIERSKVCKLRTLLITSPLPHDGKSTVALNLATALAEQGKRSVLLVEGDLHHPQFLEQLGLEQSVGFGECLEDCAAPLSTIRKLEPLGWYLLPAGRLRKNATELLQKTAAADLFQNLAPHFDWILIDSPPVLPLTDALSLRQRADACLLVVRADATPRDAVDQAVNLIGKEQILGLVLNGVEGLHRMYSKYGYYRS